MHLLKMIWMFLFFYYTLMEKIVTSLWKYFLKLSVCTIYFLLILSCSHVCSFVLLLSCLFVLALQWSRSFRGVFGETNQSELAAFTSYALAFPNNFLALVDTYDVSKTFANFDFKEYILFPRISHKPFLSLNILANLQGQVKNLVKLCYYV